MWDQMKQAKELYRLQKELAKEKIEEEEDGVKVIVNGKMEVESITLNENLDKDRQERALISCFNGAMKKIQINLAQKMKSMQ